MIRTDSKQALVDHLVLVRALVLTLGEARHANWWKSEFLSPTGLSFFSRLYPRNTFALALRSASRSALDLHDSSIGKGEVFHLFRLPNEFEIEMDERLSENSRELGKQFLDLSDNRENLLSLLSNLAEKKGEFKSGPIQIPYEKAVLAETMAAAYLWAFEKQEQIFPYFLLETH